MNLGSYFCLPFISCRASWKSLFFLGFSFPICKMKEALFSVFQWININAVVFTETLNSFHDFCMEVSWIQHIYTQYLYALHIHSGILQNFSVIEVWGQQSGWKFVGELVDGLPREVGWPFMYAWDNVILLYYRMQTHWWEVWLCVGGDNQGLSHPSNGVALETLGT